MTGEWIRFGFVALFLISSLVCFTLAVTGVYRLGFILNRMHAAGIGDTLGLLFATIACFIAPAELSDTLKIILLVLFMWFTSPVSTHFLSQVEYYTNSDLYRYTDRDLSVRR
ncbi:MAG: monovalent cation/H(+) antiporter subunit G [Lachnospiraceae bacterium]|nr:monovalent cation/H(+) antiporter subunit G [Lachnospiraceae bacterium]